MQGKGQIVGGNAEREPQVTAQLRKLEKAIERMSESVGSLDDRITSILMPSEPRPCETEPKKAPSAVPLVQELDRLTERVEQIAGRTMDVLSRVEL